MKDRPDTNLAKVRKCTTLPIVRPLRFMSEGEKRGDDTRR